MPDVVQVESFASPSIITDDSKNVVDAVQLTVRIAGGGVLRLMISPEAIPGLISIADQLRTLPPFAPAKGSA